MNLFQLGTFALHSGRTSHYRIECDSFSPDDWRALARMATDYLPRFGRVEGVPRGGIPSADALREYAVPDRTDVLLLAEDVCTTGASLNQFRDGRLAIGVCVFARNVPPWWVVPLFQMPAVVRV